MSSWRPLYLQARRAQKYTGDIMENLGDPLGDSKRIAAASECQGITPKAGRQDLKLTLHRRLLERLWTCPHF